MVIVRRLSRCCCGLGELVEANQRLEARVAELERRLNRSSRNSSLPPSQDPPSAPPRPGGKGSGRGRGGQPGHEGKHRRLLPPERVDEVVEHWPERCRSCAHVFAERERVEAARAVAPPSRGAAADRGQGDRASAARCVLPGVRDRDAGRASPRGAAVGVRAAAAGGGRDARGQEPCLPPRHDRARPRAVRGRALDRVGRRDHPACRGGARRAAHPARAADQVSLGRQHRRDRLEDRRRPPHALGRVDQPHRGVPDRGRPARLRGQDAARRATSPGSSARTAGAATTTSTRPSGSSAGRTCSATSPPTAKAWPSRKQFGHAGLAIAHDLFAAWDELPTRRRPRPPPSPDRAAPRQAPRRCSSTPPARAPEPSTTASSPGTCSTAGPRSGPSPHTDGVEPTNNHAERGLRGAVIYRKLSLGSQSEQGERTIERLLSASITCRLRKQSLYAYLTDVLTAHARGDPIPRPHLTPPPA